MREPATVRQRERAVEREREREQGTVREQRSSATGELRGSAGRGGRRARAGALIVALGAILALSFASAPSATAHDYLVSSSPAAGSTVTTPPSDVSLTFNDLVLDLSGDSSSAIMEVTGPNDQGLHFETGCASILGRTVSVPVQLGASGVYTVSWQVVSSDGHPVADSLAFDYAAPDAAATSSLATTAPGAAAGPLCGGVSLGAASPGAAASTPPGDDGGGGAVTGTAAPSAAPAAAPSGAEAPADAAAPGGAVDAPLVLGVAGAIVVLAGAGVVLVLVSARRRDPRDQTDRSDRPNPSNRPGKPDRSAQPDRSVDSPGSPSEGDQEPLPGN